ENTESPSTSADWSATERKLWRSRVAPELLETAAPGEIDLATGSPPFPVSPDIKKAVTARVGEIEHLSYPPTEGAEDLREAIAEFDRKHLGAAYTAKGIVITYGAMQALSNVIGAMTRPG